MSVTLGTMDWRLGVDNSGFQQGLSNAESQAHKVGKSITGALALGAKVAFAGAVVGVGALGAVLAASVKEASAAEEVTAQLEAVIKSTGGVAGMTADAVNDLGLSLSEVTRFEDDAIVASSALLLTFTKIGQDVFPKAQKSVLNMATAMKMDLQAATVMVGKALNDPILGITAMSRAGIQFTKDQKETIKTMVEMGDVAGAQAMILAELEVQFGGSAEAAGQTMAGQLDILKNALGNVKEEIGFALIPALKTLVTWAAPRLISVFRSLSETITTSARDIGSFFSIVKDGAKYGWNFEMLLAEIKDKLPNLPVLLQDAAAGVAAFVQGFTAEEGNLFEKIRAGIGAVDWGTIAADIKTGAVNIWNGISEAVASVDWAKVAADINTFANEALTGLQIAWDKIDWAKIQADLTVYWTNTLQPALRSAWEALEVATANDPELAEKIGTGLGKTVNDAIAFFNQTPTELEPLDFTLIFTSNLTGQQVFDLMITPEERASLKRTFEAFFAELNKNPDTSDFLSLLKFKIDNIDKALKDTMPTKSLFDSEFGKAIAHPFDAIAAAIRGVINMIRDAIAAYHEFQVEMGGGIFGGVTAGGAVAAPYLPVMTAPSAPSGIPGAGRSANGTGMEPVPITVIVNAAGGGPDQVRAAANTGTLEALRARGYR